jgi:hypothetical protein
MNPSVSTKRNHWLQLPAELQEHILGLADPFTQYLHQRGEFYNRYLKYQEQERLNIYLEPSKWLCREVLEFWSVLFATDWPGDLRALPIHLLMKVVAPRNYSDSDKDYSVFVKNVKSRSMWRHLNDVLPFVESTGRYSDDIINILAAIAMRHMWHDFVVESGVGGISNQLYVAVNNALSGYVLYLETQGTKVSVYTWDQILRNAARFGYQEGFEVAYQRTSQHSKYILIRLAMTRGHLDLIKHIQGDSAEDLVEGFSLACRYGHVKIARFFHSRLVDEKVLIGHSVPELFNAAISKGHLEVAKFLDDRYGPFQTVDFQSVDSAAQRGCWPMLRYLSKHHRKQFRAQTYYSALSVETQTCDFDEDQIATLKFLAENVPQCRQVAMMLTARHRPQLLPNIHGSRCSDKCHPSGMDFSVRFTNESTGLEAVKFLNENCNAGCTFRALKWAKEMRRQALVEYLQTVEVRDMGIEEYKRGVHLGEHNIDIL